MLSSESAKRYGVRRTPERSWLDGFTAVNEMYDAGPTDPAMAVSTEKTRVMIAEDHPVIREGLSTIIASRGDMEVAADCRTGREAIQKYFECNPDVVLVGLRGPSNGGLETIAAICQQHPSSRLMIVSHAVGEESVYQALKAGARGYLITDAPLNDFFEALKCVAAGQSWVSPKLKQILAKRALEQELTPRELEVLRAIASGKSNKEIGAALNISESTVKVHVTHILGKLKATGRTAAIHTASRRGLVQLDSSAA
jgi:two-component system NarL family response regulator